jgi:hypothetical protein
MGSSTDIAQAHNRLSSLDMDSCRFGIREHFTQSEWESIAPNWCTWKKVYKFTTMPLAHYEQPEVLNHSKSYAEMRYIGQLAFFQRIRLPLPDILPVRFPRYAFPIDQTSNFRELRRIFDTYYPELFKLEARSERQRQFRYDQVELIARSFSIIRGRRHHPVPHDCHPHRV